MPDAWPLSHRPGQNHGRIPAARAPCHPYRGPDLARRHGGTAGEARLLASCYRESLTLAVANDIRSIAFPAIGCGVYGYPVPEAAEIAIETAAAFLTDNETIESVVFACFDDYVFQAFQNAAVRKTTARNRLRSAP